MRKLLSVLGLVAALLFAPAKVEAQSPSYGCCGFHDWLTYGSNDLFRWHPSADFMGGTAMVLIARSPVFSDGIRKHRIGRLAVVAVGAAAWQFQNLKEIQWYRWDYAAYDFTWTVTSALISDLIIEEVF